MLSLYLGKSAIVIIQQKTGRKAVEVQKAVVKLFFFFLDKIVSGQKILKALSSSYWGYPGGYIRVGKGYVLPVSRLFCLIIDPFFSFLLLPSLLISFASQKVQ